MRVIKVELEPVRSSNRQAAAANAHISGARERFKITDDSLLAIRAEMPTENEQWKVEAVVQYRCQYGTEQWLVKWKDY